MERKRRERKERKRRSKNGKRRRRRAGRGSETIGFKKKERKLKRWNEHLRAREIWEGAGKKKAEKRKS